MKEKGITLIALIITVVVISVLSVTAIRFATGNNGIINTARNAKAKTILANKQEEVQLAINTLILENNGNKSKVTVEAVERKLREGYSSQEEKNAINGMAIRDGEESEEETFPGTITFSSPVSGISGEVIVKVDENLKVTKDLDIGTRVELAESDYTKVANVYSNAPELTRFNSKNTYYVTYDASENETIEGRIDKVEKPENWYDYGNQKWANIVTINNGITTYWTWVPRYKYQITNNAGGDDTVEVQFVKTDNTCTVIENGEENPNKDLSDYILPDAFTFGGKQLAGYWVSKYEVQEAKLSDSVQIIRMGQNLRIETGDSNATYSVWINGVKKAENQTAADNIVVKSKNYDIWLWDETARKVVNPVIVDIEDAIKIDLSGFNLACTSYVLYDEEENESLGDLIQVDEEGSPTNAPEDWYNYLDKRWANIATFGNGILSYWTYIPRYEYRIWNNGANITTSYISVDQEEADEGCIIPDAFKFGGKQLAGYWVSKYEAQDYGQYSKTESITALEVNSKIKVYSIDSSKNSNSYTIYVNGVKIAEHINLPYGEIQGTNQDKNILVYDETNHKIIAPVKVKGISSEEVQVDLSGFEANCTYYVEYDANGNEKTGERTKIQLNAQGKATNIPQNWYDYGNKKWANVVTINSGLTTYWTYVPRYQYKIEPETNTVDVVYISKETTTANEGYIIPEAFTFGGEQLSGYWVSKYEVQE